MPALHHESHSNLLHCNYAVIQIRPAAGEFTYICNHLLLLLLLCNKLMPPLQQAELLESAAKGFLRMQTIEVMSNCWRFWRESSSAA